MMMKRVKSKVFDAMCKVGLHQWYLRATGKKNGKVVKIQKCRHCKKDRTK